MKKMFILSSKNNKMLFKDMLLTNCLYNKIATNFSIKKETNGQEDNHDFEDQNNKSNSNRYQNDFNNDFKRFNNNNDGRNSSYRRDNYSSGNNNYNQMERKNYNNNTQRRYRDNYGSNSRYDNNPQYVNSTIDADTIWGKRYMRNGYLDSYIHHKTHKLMEISNKYENTSTEEKELIYDDNVFKELKVYFKNKPVNFNEEAGKAINEFNSIENYGLHDILRQNLKKIKINKLAPIQHRVLSLTSDSKDIIGCAQTGSGKTLAFLLPLIDKMLKNGPPEFKEGFVHDHLISGMSYPTSLILSPTRELANQIYDECLKLCYNTGIVPVVVFGGERREIQSQHVERGADIIIATPGRLLDFMNSNIKLKYVDTLVLDEADMMLDLGFEDQLHQIMNSFDLPHKSKRKNLFFSATFEKEIISIANDFLNEYYFIGSLDRAFTLNKRIEQNFVYQEGERISTLLENLNKYKDSKIIIFTNSKIDCKNINSILSKNGLNSCAIHGDCDQNQRLKMLNGFKNGYYNILCATDVASRGLDISNVDLVINYDVPQNIDSYVHRIGRTGRKGKDGQVLTFLSNLSSYVVVKDIKNLLMKEKINHSSDLDMCLQKCDKKQKPFFKSFRGNGSSRFNNRNNNSNSYNDNISSNEHNYRKH